MPENDKKYHLSHGSNARQCLIEVAFGMSLMRFGKTEGVPNAQT